MPSKKKTVDKSIFCGLHRFAAFCTSRICSDFSGNVSFRTWVLFSRDQLLQKKNRGSKRHLITPKFIQTFLDAGHQPEEVEENRGMMIWALIGRVENVKLGG